MSMPTYRIRLILVLYVLLVVLVSLCPGGGPSLWRIGKELDAFTLVHFIAYSGMAVLALLSFGSRTARLVALLSAVGLGAMLEWGQSFVPGREMSLVDQMINTLGVLSGTLFFRLQGRALVDWLESFFKQPA